MAVMQLVRNEKNVVYHRVITEITDEYKKQAREIFEVYKQQGIIDSEFSDDIWKITNEIEWRTINMSFDEIAAQKKLEEITPKELKEIFKTFMMLCFGGYSLHKLSRISKDIRKVMDITEFFTKYPEEDQVLKNAQVQSFLGLIPNIDEIFIIETEYIDNEKGKLRRSLAEYESYFLFNDILNDYFPKATLKEKELFFPVYIWWKVTTILPLRPTELSVIPKDCLRKYQGEWYITIRRTQMKGRSSRKTKYKVDEDYRKYEYKTTEEIANIILEYKNLCEKYPEQKGDSLLSSEMFHTTYALKRRIKTHKDEKYITPKHMGKLLELFYYEVIEKKYNYNVLNKNEATIIDDKGEEIALKDNEIVKMNLGDTRHIAIQNLILNGCNILLASEITGHEEIANIIHYAGNMKNLTKCRAYSLNRKSRREKEIQLYIGGNRADQILNPISKVSYINVDAGKCYSPNMVDNGDAHDCYTVAGDCSCCKYFQCENIEQLESIKKEYEKKFEEKLFRIKKWFSSESNTKLELDLQVYAEQLRTMTESLETIYIQELNFKENM